MDLSEEVMRALDKMGMKTPTSVQKQAIPLMMDNRCVIAKAPTGTGKTFAFRSWNISTWMPALFRP